MRLIDADRLIDYLRTVPFADCDDGRRVYEAIEMQPIIEDCRDRLDNAIQEVDHWYSIARAYEEAILNLVRVAYTATPVNMKR